MKERRLILTPVLVLSFLVSCNYKDTPTTSELKPQTTICTITFDAKDGLFGNTSRHVCFSVPSNTKLHPYINMMKDFEPILKGEIFAYYSYKDSNAIIDYEDVIKGDITLEANYFPVGNGEAPYNDLDEFDWNIIKQVAVTKKDPSEVFKVGATKTVNLYNQPHEVRIIGYNHDKLASETNEDIKTGLTFEFANLITKEDGASYTTYWNENDTNVFIGSTFYTLLNGEPGSEKDCIFNNLPNDLKDVVQLVEKYVGVGFEKDITPVRDSTPYDTKLFPLAHNEMKEDTSSHLVPVNEGTPYKYYEVHGTGADRIKECVGGGSEPYWLRSPYCALWYYHPCAWMVFNGTGNLADRNVYEPDPKIAFAPAFCI